MTFTVVLEASMKVLFVLLALLGTFLLCAWLGLTPLFMGGAMALVAVLGFWKL